ncbi:MAG TPA: nitrogenase-stabilizing/protective protein NifW [Pseudonocardiaceae bacterium]
MSDESEELSATERLIRFHQCGTAEEFLRLLDVPFDPRVVNVNRLHILKLFAAKVAELHEQRTAEQPAERVLADYRVALEASYREFTTSTALDHRLFKVLRDRAPRAFVPLQEVQREVLR